MTAFAFFAFDVIFFLHYRASPYMWNNFATQANIKTLKERNFIIVEPMSGKVACGDVGYGKLPDDQVLLNIVNNTLGKEDPINEKLKDKQAIITIGSTRERIDPVRFIGNYSTGEQGLLIAEELRRYGCEVSIISGYTTKEIPEYFKIIKAYTATDMLNASLSLMPADIFIGCAAICDFKPKEFSQQKIKKCNIPKTFQQADLILSGERSECSTTYMRTRSHEKIKNGFLKGEGYKKISLDLIETVDVIGSIGSMKENRPSVVVGFALESSDFKENAKAKLKSKNLDLIVLNKSNEMFNENKEFALFSAKGNVDVGKLSKRQLSSELISQIAFFINSLRVNKSY